MSASTRQLLLICPLLGRRQLVHVFSPPVNLFVLPVVNHRLTFVTSRVPECAYSDDARIDRQEPVTKHIGHEHTISLIFDSLVRYGIAGLN